MPAVAKNSFAVAAPADVADVADALDTSRHAFGGSPVHPLQQRLADHFAGADALRQPGDYAWGAKAAIILAAALSVWMALGAIAYVVLNLG